MRWWGLAAFLPVIMDSEREYPPLLLTNAYCRSKAATAIRPASNEIRLLQIVRFRDAQTSGLTPTEVDCWAFLYRWTSGAAFRKDC